MKQWFSYLLGWVLGLLFIYLAFRGQSFDSVFSLIRTADYQWPILILIMSVAVHVIRAWRWALLIEPLGCRVSVLWCFLAIMVGYVVNLGVPRLGEITRCAVVKKNSILPFGALFGTVIVERAVDIACLLLAFLLAVLLEWQKVASLTFSLAQALQTIISDSVLFLSLALVFVALLVFLVWKFKFLQKIAFKLSSVIDGLLTVTKLRNPATFWLLTLVTWLSYFFMTQLWFFCFEDSSQISWISALVFMTFGSLGRSLPIQGGGVGAYHYLFTQVALIYGLSQPLGLAIATLNHGLQVIYYLIVGSACAIVVAAFKPKKFDLNDHDPHH